jgi:hypothetical protein
MMMTSQARQAPPRQGGAPRPADLPALYPGPPGWLEDDTGTLDRLSKQAAVTTEFELSDIQVIFAIPCSIFY